MNEPRKPLSIRAETVPDLLSLSPAMAKRAWARFVADHEPPADHVQRAAEYVAFALDEWQLNQGTDAEEVSRKNLADKLDLFKSALAADQRQGERNYDDESSGVAHQRGNAGLSNRRAKN